jgi:hypothetical protein
MSNQIFYKRSGVSKVWEKNRVKAITTEGKIDGFLLELDLLEQQYSFFQKLIRDHVQKCHMPSMAVNILQRSFAKWKSQEHW